MYFWLDGDKAGSWGLPCSLPMENACLSNRGQQTRAMDRSDENSEGGV